MMIHKRTDDVYFSPFKLPLITVFLLAHRPKLRLAQLSVIWFDGTGFGGARREPSCC